MNPTPLVVDMRKTKLEREFTASQVMDLLCHHNKLLVHFSGAPRGCGKPRRDNLFPNDLQHILNDQAQGGVSCSTVGPGDSFEIPHSNATGCVGLILKPREAHSILNAKPDDIGSSETKGGSRGPIETTLTITDLEKSIEQRETSCYNEWIVADYDVVGVFAAPPFLVTQSTNLKVPEDMPDYLRVDGAHEALAEISVEEIRRRFSNRQVYGVYNGCFIHYTSTGPKAITWAKIYGS